MNRYASKNSSDEELVMLSANGDRKAFELIYERYSGRLYGYFLKMLDHDQATAEDMTQEIFLKLVKSAKNFDGKRSFKTWIFSIANNMCKNVYRHNEVKREAADELSYKSVLHHVKNEEDMDKKTFKAELDKALSSLDERKRSSFILRFKHDLSIKEIAEITNASEGTVKSRLFYSLRELSSMLHIFNPIK